MITREELDALSKTNERYYAEGGRYGRAWPMPKEFPALFRDPDYYNLPARLAALRPGDRVVDILCGNPVPGALCVALARSQPAATVIGLDPSQLLLDTCRDNLASVGLRDAQWVLSDDERPALPARSVDVIVNRLGLHHVVDLTVTFGEYLRLLRPGGRVVLLDFTVPDRDADSEAFINRIYRSRDKTHVKIRSVAEVREALAASGLTVTRNEPWAIRHVTTEFGFADAQARASYFAEFHRGSARARSVHRVADLPGGELTFTHPAMVLSAALEEKR